MTQIKQDHYQEFREFLERSCGIVLGDNKQYLVASRLGQLMSQHGYRDLGELVGGLGAARNHTLRGQVIEAMTTNETQWFRDVYPFEILRQHLLPEFHAQGRRRPRIWSAACSSGQEAYSISMVLQEYNEQGRYLDAEIIGTDISPAVIEQARAARYNSATVNRGLSPERRQRYFVPVGDEQWEVKPEIRRRASFRIHNLLESFSLLGRFDLIFCRNVLIYFSAESRQDILHRMAKLLNPGGYLLLGASEAMSRNGEDFEMQRTPQGAVYKVRR